MMLMVFKTGRVSLDQTICPDKFQICKYLKRFKTALDFHKVPNNDHYSLDILKL